ncbi:hypothetical protein B0T21DRAFT_415275 [Apiosordaria backusii]|uniref:N-acetylglucosaminylphosphatidylinositol deacetylase n=1 Tax=Apiosordaria backusii TaxID=314023 RepID=A0AA40AIM7_9PEZI|nr:hypothetical protein B0T21DRAFT_415275 [Apiosordaria backusii]
MRNSVVYGVLGHPNHISLYHGAEAFVAHGEPGRESPVDLYTLKSVSLLRKYISVLDVFATLMTAWGRGVGRGDMAHPDGLIFMAGLFGAGGVSTAWRAMTRAHRSQMLWFRYGWVAFSRYMVMNDLSLEDKPESVAAPSLLCQSCHDIDFILWLVCYRTDFGEPAHMPSLVSSVGNLSLFTKHQDGEPEREDEGDDEGDEDEEIEYEGNEGKGRGEEVITVRATGWLDLSTERCRKLACDNIAALVDWQLQSQ